MKDKYKDLMDTAVKAKEFSYSPYSSFRVGAAVLDTNGNIYSGCNIENASYGATNCAERTAIFKGVSEGVKEICAIAVSADDEEFTYPCGICRQVIREFGSKVDVILINKKGEVRESTIQDLLPNSFSKEDLL